VAVVVEHEPLAGAKSAVTGVEGELLPEQASVWHN
jgi:hypothetical protein